MGRRRSGSMAVVRARNATYDRPDTDREKDREANCSEREKGTQVCIYRLFGYRRDEKFLQRRQMCGKVSLGTKTIVYSTVRSQTRLCSMTYAWSLPDSVEHMRQTTRLHPALSWAAAFIFLQLYLKLAVHVSFSKSLSSHLLFSLVGDRVMYRPRSITSSSTINLGQGYIVTHWCEIRRRRSALVIIMVQRTVSKKE